MSLSKASNKANLKWLIHPKKFLFFKIFVWFWLTVIGTIASLVFLSNIATNQVSNEKLRGPMQKNLEYTAKSIERSVTRHKKSVRDILSHPRLAKRKLLYLNSDQPELSLSSQVPPNEVDLSLLNFTKSMEPQVIFTEHYQAFGPIKVNVPEGLFYLYEINVNHQTPFFIRLKLMPIWLKILIALLASLALSFVFSRSLIAPINSLKQAAIALANGDLSARAKIDPQREDELGVLGRDFNSMAIQLERLLSAQKRLLADISHELRSPLTRLKMATGLAQMQTPEENQTYLLRIEKEANQLDKMIADVLQVSRLEAKSQALSLHKQSIEVIVEHVLNDAQFEANQSAKQLIVNGQLNAELNCDEALIASALENVLRNAIKYAEHTIHLTLQQSDAIYIEISDDGPGVAPENLTKLCEPFFRQSDARDRTSGGTGLGLAIAKNAIIAHNGSLTLHNHQQGGLCVQIVLPLDKH
ncbi:histidine kinase [Pseudoalteromonas porphyrae]|uniref:histidine kinase n=2 Tax=Pseudoalteromonas TaxID=53246 RepID=A0A0N1EWW3_9GAMM|nr:MULTISPECIES: ATP-binding protein [Pseudoalteromonas]KPH62752.1 histidine kinase [Pseudoalteromonas porphyrae]KPH96603.1 histidine kinase [Pseudoalteromonas porphyrae]NNG45363.1 HAMP domain-containing protein [Pseudoalteromonas sp. NEC-BIFX-2020_002]